jgi:hypothetical protein
MSNNLLDALFGVADLVSQGQLSRVTAHLGTITLLVRLALYRDLTFRITPANILPKVGLF